MKQGHVLLKKKDYEIFLFIWRWKVVTSKMIEMRFYPESKGQAAYLRLWRLARAGFVKSICDVDRTHTFWTLKEKAFFAIKPALPPLVADGFKSENVKHDFLAAIAHLGDCLVADQNHVGLFSEQELRLIDPTLYPPWVPKSQVRRPDGYWYVLNGKQAHLIALEVELNQKTTDIYESIGRFYLEDTKVDQVIWITKKKSIANGIQKAILSAIRSETNLHSFILLDDYLNHHWQAKIVIGKDAGKTLDDVLAITPQECRKVSCRMQFFDTRKIPINSATNKNLETFKFCH